MDPILKTQLSGCTIRIRQKSPFFAVLMAYLKPSEMPAHWKMQTAATDSVSLFLSKDWFLALRREQRDGVVLHEVLHAAMGHCWRCGFRIPELWNIACDYVVNAIVRAAGYELPEGHLYDEKYARRREEEVYEMLLKDPDWKSIVQAGSGWGGPDLLPGEGSGKSRKQSEDEWKQAKANAKSVAEGHGSESGKNSWMAELEESQVDWRSVVWNELSYSPTEFKNFDRRFVCDELYVEGFEPEETLNDVGICCDTSGSVVQVVGKFTGEIKQVHDMYPNVDIDVYWLDVDLVGPISVEDLDKPMGGGGTDFRPFFKKAEEEQYKLAIFLTDGYGTFPEETPSMRTIWVVCAGGLTEFPFGEVVRILE